MEDNVIYQNIQELVDTISSTKYNLDQEQDDCYYCPLREESELYKEGYGKLSFCEVLVYILEKLGEMQDE